jgi:ribosomal protein S18 acetylase RimI-like enzyme
MRTLDELEEKLKPYQGCVTRYYPDLGYIVWREGTGNNLELLFIEVLRTGAGALLIKEMVDELLRAGKEPYHSVFAFTLASNLKALVFYLKLGFRDIDLGRSIYRDEATVLLTTTWEDLVKEFKRG